MRLCGDREAQGGGFTQAEIRLSHVDAFHKGVPYAGGQDSCDTEGEGCFAKSLHARRVKIVQ